MGKPADRVAEKSRKYIITDDYGSKIDSIVLQCEGVAIAEKARFAKLLPQVYDRSPACTRVFQAYFSFLCAERTRHLRDIGPAKPPGPVEAEELRSCLKWCKRQLGQPNVKLAAKHREEVARLVPLIEARLGELDGVVVDVLRPGDIVAAVKVLGLADTKVGREGVEAHRRKEEEQVAARVWGEAKAASFLDMGLKPDEANFVIDPGAGRKTMTHIQAMLDHERKRRMHPADEAVLARAGERKARETVARSPVQGIDASDLSRAAGDEVQDSVVVVTKKTSDRGGVLL